MFAKEKGADEDDKDPPDSFYAEQVAQYPGKTPAELCQTIELRHRISMVPPERRALLARAIEASVAGATANIGNGNGSAVHDAQAKSDAIRAQAKNSAPNGDLAPDIDQVERFVDLVFRHADKRHYVSMCAFPHDRSEKAVFKRGIRLDAPQLVGELRTLISRAANNYIPAVFCPPIATFDSMFSAKTENLVECFVLHVECDERPNDAMRQLTEVLGTPTVTVASGGEWTNPETGEVEDKKHGHWRLTVPTRTAEEHAALREARALAAKLVGADTSGVALVHPMRWPGSWHTKNKDKPRLTRIVQSDGDVEVDLDAALAGLREVAGVSGASQEPTSADQQLAREPDKCAYAISRLADWRADDRSAWIDVGHAIKASFDDERGFQLFNEFSRRCKEKYDEADMRTRWDGFQPNSIGAGSIYAWADKDAPGWHDDYDATLEAALNGVGEEDELREGVFGADGARSEEVGNGAQPKHNGKAQGGAGPRSLASDGDARKQKIGTNSRAREAPEIVRGSTIERRQIEWLWHKRIALGKITIIAGEPGLGKSQVSLDLVARITKGSTMPCGEGTAPLGSAIILSAEDDPEDTVGPRLDAAGADADRWYLLKAIKLTDGKGRRIFNIGEDIPHLETAVRAIGDVKLIVIDPLSAYLGRAGQLNTWKDSDVRATLAPLQEMAADHKLGVVGVTHFNKSATTNAKARITGSGAFVAAARAAYVVVREEDDPEHRLFLPAKNNLGNDSTGLAFKIVEKAATHPLRAPAVEWEEGIVTTTADEALAAEAQAGKEGPSAKAFLETILANGPRPATEVEKLGAEAGFSERQMRRAREKLAVWTKRNVFGKGGRQFWGLPEHGQEELPV
jgi:putative DNA primase/helicase